MIRVTCNQQQRRWPIVGISRTHARSILRHRQRRKTTMQRNNNETNLTKGKHAALEPSDLKPLHAHAAENGNRPLSFTHKSKRRNTHTLSSSSSNMNKTFSGGFTGFARKCWCAHLGESSVSTKHSIDRKNSTKNAIKACRTHEIDAISCGCLCATYINGSVCAGKVERKSCEPHTHTRAP